ncbi:MAG TPA: DUF1549 domain-containing protein [Bryobacteraceae bacterium]|nr:DUF1549 domain-containing protein [Bryobacteraceae bacterium]
MHVRWFVLLLIFATVSVNAQGTEKVDFVRDVQPVLTDKCMSCHSADSPQAGLRTHTREDLLKGGNSGPALIPGKGAESLMILKMQGRKGLRMPPAGPPLSSDTIARIKLWIDQGASFDGAKILSERVAPLAPRTPQVPAGSAANPIDRFIDAYFARQKIAAPSVVSDARFARRVTYDITGLPPTPEELASFEQQTTPTRREALIDSLLAKRGPYAEHWISFWNDLLRNDEGVIYHGERKSITKWLQGALARNLPYNVMVQTLLNPQKGSEAEGFLVGVSWRGVVSASQSPAMQAAQNAAQVFLGMNLKCAACHDSFINRWKLKDTYGLAAMFSDEQLELVRCDIPLGVKAEPSFPMGELKVSFGQSVESRRAAAAEWVVHPQNGRFARTIVNRYWKQLFGRGIVDPADDMDAEPWNEDLLDWLASDFTANGYDLQHLLRQIMTSRAYQYDAVTEPAASKTYVFRGPWLRRLSAEQFEDTISVSTGDWRVNNPRAETRAAYTRVWRLKSDPLSRALGRPIRDQVYTERSSAASTLQALELTNGPLLSRRLERGAKALLGELKPAPANLFDSKLVRGGAIPVEVDVRDAKELWLVVEDVDSYDPARVLAGWANAELEGPDGVVRLADLPLPSAAARNEQLQLKTEKQPVIIAPVPSMLRWKLDGRKFTRFRALAAVDERSRVSDVGPAVRFFVFREQPDKDRLVRVQGEPPYMPPQQAWTTAELVSQLYLRLLSRTPSATERRVASGIVGSTPTAQTVEDLLWALLMHPEFQYIH